jgi:serine phosphatase RsbU (regulator of sigma subunit)/integral membrane sensor domain MASE1
LITGSAIRGFTRRFESAGILYVLAILFVAAVYVVFAKIGLSLAFSVRQVTPVWPPSGIAVAVLLLGGFRFWPAIYLGAFVANALSAEPLLTAAGIAVGNTLGPVIGAFLLRRFSFKSSLDRVHDVLALTALGGLLAMTVPASLGTLNLAIAGIIPWSDYLAVWQRWWAGDAVGVLLFAPLLLTWATESRRSESDRARWIELLALAVASVGLSAIGFFTLLRIGFVVYPPITWSGLRFSQRVTSSAIVVISVLAIWATKNDLGPFHVGTLDERLGALVVFMAVLAVTGLVLGAVTAEREVAEEQQRALEKLELARARHIAEELQQAFMPKSLPRHPDLQFDSLYLPGELEALIGGDWYDAFAIPDGRIVVSIGDMVGHGIDASVNAVEMRQRIFATAFSVSDPAQILIRVNDMLRDDEDVLATGLVAFIDPKSSTLHYASAGHPPPIIAGSKISARILPYGGLPLGVLKPLDVQTHIVQLERHAFILFYTDGLTEFAHNIDLAERTLLDAAQALVQNPETKNPALALQRRVMGEKQNADDTVIMVVRLAPSTRRSTPQVSIGSILHKRAARL